MARQKRSIPHIVDLAKKRMAGLKTIDPELDLGNGLSVLLLEERVSELVQGIDTYNSRLADMDVEADALDRRQREVAELHSRLLEGVGARFGKESDEYEQAGGTRLSQRRQSRQG